MVTMLVVAPDMSLECARQPRLGPVGVGSHLISRIHDDALLSLTPLP